jgi:CheY-like chemotaxis protein
MLRETIREILSDCGYKVLTAVNGRDALVQAENLVNPVDLLLTDAVMPGMGGFELVRRLRLRWPDLKVLQMSGYSQESLARREKRNLAGYWLPKPFTPEQLAAKVREVIDSEARTERPSGAQK